MSEGPRHDRGSHALATGAGRCRRGDFFAGDQEHCRRLEVAVQGKLRLGSGQTELTGVFREPGAAVVFQKQRDAPGQIIIVDPMHVGSWR